jgi:hypothetical protein
MLQVLPGTTWYNYPLLAARVEDGVLKTQRGTPCQSELEPGTGRWDYYYTTRT